MGMAKSVSWQYYDEPEGSSETYWPAAGGLPPPGSVAAPVPVSPYGGVAGYTGAVAAGSAAGVAGAAVLAPEAYLPRRNLSPTSTTPGSSFYTQPAAVLQGTYLQQAPQHDWLPKQVSAQVPVMSLPQDTIIIFDWDDTLMCSSAINANQLLPHQAAQLEALLEQVLTISMRLGETCIVTNADELWVLESTRRFTPRVMPLLSQMSVVSARRKYERSCPGDVFAWKRETFREVLAARKGASAGLNGSLNLVVLGDSPAEMEAAQTSTLGATHPIAIKTVKFKETPTAEELLEQLRIVAQDLSVIVADDKSSCRSLVQWMRPQQPQLQPQLAAVAPAATYTTGPTVSPTFAYSPPVIAAPYAAPAGAYLGAQMIYAAGH